MPINSLTAQASKRLRKALSMTGLSKESVARETSVSVAQLYAWLNPNNPRFPNAFQLDSLCGVMDVDCTYVLTGRSENRIREYQSALDHVGATRGQIPAICGVVHRCPGSNSPAHYLDETKARQAALDQARQRLRSFVKMKYAKDGPRLLAEALNLQVRKVRRWISAQRPEGFPDPFTLLAICKHLNVDFGDVIHKPVVNISHLLTKEMNYVDCRATVISSNEIYEHSVNMMTIAPDVANVPNIWDFTNSTLKGDLDKLDELYEFVTPRIAQPAKVAFVANVDLTAFISRRYADLFAKQKLLRFETFTDLRRSLQWLELTGRGS